MQSTENKLNGHPEYFGESITIHTQANTFSHSGIYMYMKHHESTMVLILLYLFCKYHMPSKESYLFHVIDGLRVVILLLFPASTANSDTGGTLHLQRSQACNQEFSNNTTAFKSLKFIHHGWLVQLQMQTLSVAQPGPSRVGESPTRTTKLRKKMKKN